ncbi:MAG: helix-turn-helix domain-containing protein [Anaerolineae bacterium]|nr:helix-turn-helix domain-containing protein [Anaerolineae bacterium]MCI0608013.1 helix-turn-helix domain-containing protein [Anaerolineae bacterium]
MTEFGRQLRKFRQQCNDPLSPHGKLTQEKFGELLGEALGIRYSGAAVSDWERGVSKIHADQRQVLISILKVLAQRGGIKTVMEANQLLEAGNYRALNTKEVQQIFPNVSNDLNIKHSIPKQKISKSFVPFLLADLFHMSEDELQGLLAKAEKGPPPAWPRILAAFMRKAFDHLSFSTVIWIWLWLIAWWLVTPSWRRLFENRDVALIAIGMYVGGSLGIPLLIGLLVNTKDNDYWKGQTEANSFLVRLYTYQGAGIGFNLGYFLIFPLSLARHYLNLESAAWVTILVATLGLILGNMSARVVPYNLWVAYGRLRFSDGAIFFVVALLGPMWGLFFLEYYSIFQSPVWGTLVILLAVTLAAMITTRQSNKKLYTEQ